MFILFVSFTHIIINYNDAVRKHDAIGSNSRFIHAGGVASSNQMTRASVAERHMTRKQGSVVSNTNRAESVPCFLSEEDALTTFHAPISHRAD